MLLQGVLTALVLGFLVYTVVRNWHELRDQGLGLTVGWFASGLVALLVFQLSAGFAWLVQLRMLGQSPSPIRAQMVWAKSLLARYVPGGLVFIFSRVVLNEREGVPRRVTITAMVYETGLQFAAAAAFAGCLLLADSDRSAAWLGWVAVSTVPIALACMHPRLFAPILNFLFRMLGRRDVTELLGFRRILLLFAYYCVTWAVMGLAVFCIARAIYPVPGSDWGSVAAAQAVAFCVAVVSLVFPGGLGIRDGAFAWAMKVAGVNQSFAVLAAITLATRLALSGSEVIYAGAATAAARRRSRRSRTSGAPLAVRGGVESPRSGDARPPSFDPH
jgi:hypothetical protein